MSCYKPSVALVYSSVANDVNKAKGVVIVGDDSSAAVMSKRISQVDCESGQSMANARHIVDCLLNLNAKTAVPYSSGWINPSYVHDSLISGVHVSSAQVRRDVYDVVS